MSPEFAGGFLTTEPPRKPKTKNIAVLWIGKPRYSLASEQSWKPTKQNKPQQQRPQSSHQKCNFKQICVCDSWTSLNGILAFIWKHPCSLFSTFFSPLRCPMSLSYSLKRLFSAQPSGCFCLTLFLLSALGYKNPKAKHQHEIPGLSSVESGQAWAETGCSEFWSCPTKNEGFQRRCSGKEHIYQRRICKRRKISWRRKWQPTPVFLPVRSQAEEPGGLQSRGSQGVWVSDRAHTPPNENHLALVSVEITVGTFWVGQWLRIRLLGQGVWVQSPVRELRSHMPWGQNKTKKPSKSIL